MADMKRATTSTGRPTKARQAAEPQLLTVRGREAVTVISAEAFRRLGGDVAGEALIAAMQASRDRDVDIEPSRAPMPVRAVAL